MSEKKKKPGVSYSIRTDDGVVISAWSDGSPKTPATPLSEFAEAVDDPDYDPENEHPLRVQQAAAEIKRGEEQLKKAIEAGDIDVVEIPVHNLPEDMNITFKMLKKKTGDKEKDDEGKEDV